MEQIVSASRKKIFEIVCNNKAGHLASSLSSVEILTVLYFGNILRYRAQDAEWEDRDRFILSKGHSALGYYITLAFAGFFNIDEVKSFCIAGTNFGGLPLKNKVKGVEASTGSLGHGLSFAAGVAINAKIYNKQYLTYVLIGDGEAQEGSIWEAALFISQNNLTNLVTIVDYNRLQATGRCEDIISLESFRDKWESFGFEVIEVDGHNISEIKTALTIRDIKLKKPRTVIAHTVKGKGLTFVENQPDWHYKMPSKDQILNGIKELGMEQGVVHIMRDSC